MFQIQFNRFWILMLALATVVLADARSDRLLRQLQNKYESLDEVCADFTQTFHWKLTGETQQISGRICAKGGDRFRIETEEQLIITDGNTLWTLNKLNNQVIIDHAENATSENPFIKDFLEKYIREYNSRIDESASSGGDPVILLTSKTGDHFVPQMRLWVDEKQDLITKVEQTDLNENTTVFQVNNIDTDVSLSNSDFKFQAPESADVIDMR